MTPHDHDVIVLGGGPAGSLTAALLCRQVLGLRVLVLERERFPRHHVGEVTLPGWTPILKRAGVFEALDARLPIQKLGVVFRWGPSGETWTADFREEARGAPAEGSWHVDRAVLDELLLENAANQGATVRQEARVTGVDGQRVTWVEAGATRSATARWIVDATGQARLLARLKGLPVRRHEDMNNLALYGYWSGSRLTSAAAIERPEERWALVNTGEVGWVWHIPIGLDCVSVGLVTNRETVRRGEDLLEVYRRAVADTPGVGELLEDATFLGDRPAGGRPNVAVAEDWSYVVDRVCGDGWYLVGDAAVFVDPVLSSGLTLAANGASLVANAITTALDEDVDEASLQRSYARTLGGISAAYHRMARVWYGRNLSTESWHWQARRERIRLGAGLAETDAEAFTAVCLGVIASPLDAAVGRTSRDGWGGEFFNWLVSGQLFERTEGAFAGVDGGDEARAAGRRAVAARWRRIGLAGCRVRGAVVREAGWHTHRFLDRWRPVELAHVGEVTVADFGILDRLGHDVRTLDVVRDLGASPETAAAVVQALLQLDMLGELDVPPHGAPSPRWSGSAALRQVGAFLGRLGHAARVHVDVDLLGRGLWFHVRTDGVTRTHHEPAAQDLSDFLGLGLAFDHVPGRAPVAQPR